MRKGPLEDRRYWSVAFRAYCSQIKLNSFLWLTALNPAEWKSILLEGISPLLSTWCTGWGIPAEWKLLNKPFIKFSPGRATLECQNGHRDPHSHPRKHPSRFYGGFLVTQGWNCCSLGSSSLQERAERGANGLDPAVVSSEAQGVAMTAKNTGNRSSFLSWSHQGWERPLGWKMHSDVPKLSHPLLSPTPTTSPSCHFPVMTSITSGFTRTRGW